jgi:cell division protein FtsL
VSRGSTAATIDPAGVAVPPPRRGPRVRPAPRHLTVVDANARRRARRVRVAVWSFGIVTACSVFVAVAFHVMLAQSEFELDRLSSQTAAAQRRYEHARLTVAQLGAPERIVERATRLGMEPAESVIYVPVPPESGRGTSPIEDTAGVPGGEWEKVKPHLAAQP